MVSHSARAASRRSNPSGLVYASPAELKADVSRALAAGVTRDQLSVFNLNGMIDDNGDLDESWFVITKPVTPLAKDLTTSLGISGYFRALEDRSLQLPL